MGSRMLMICGPIFEPLRYRNSFEVQIEVAEIYCRLLVVTWILCGNGTLQGNYEKIIVCS